MSGTVHRILIEEEAMKAQMALLITYSSTLLRFTIEDVLNCPYQMPYKADQTTEPACVKPPNNLPA